LAVVVVLCLVGIFHERVLQTSPHLQALFRLQMAHFLEQIGALGHELGVVRARLDT